MATVFEFLYVITAPVIRKNLIVISLLFFTIFIQSKLLILAYLIKIHRHNSWTKFRKYGHSVMSGLFRLRNLQCILNSDSSWMFPKVTKYFQKLIQKLPWKGKFENGILLPKLFWPTVRKIVLVIEKNFWNSRLKAENLQKTRTIYSNSERLEQFW